MSGTARVLSRGLVILLGCLAATAAMTRGADPADQSGVPLEVQPTDAKLAKIVLIAGTPSAGPGEHEYFAGCAVLMQLLKQTPGVFPVMARDGWPKDTKTLDGARSVVFYMNGGTQPLLEGDRPAAVQKLVDAGVGLAHIHGVIDYPKDFGERARSWLGGCYEPGYSKRAHWVSEFANFPDHPIMRGVGSFTIDDGWLYHSRFVPGLKGVTPLLWTVPPAEKGKVSPPADKGAGDDALVAWTYERPGGGRSFVFTGGHLHSNMAKEPYRRFLVNACLWTAKVDVPAGGAPVALDPEDLKKNLDKKPAKAAAPAKKKK